MTDRKPGLDQCEQHLIALRDELAGRGVRCALDDRGLWPRLRIYCPDEGATAEFDNNVVAAPISGRWCFCWPWAVPIGSVSRVAQAAEDIITDLGIGDRGRRRGARRSVAGCLADAAAGPSGYLQPAHARPSTMSATHVMVQAAEGGAGRRAPGSRQGTAAAPGCRHGSSRSDDIR